MKPIFGRWAARSLLLSTLLSALAFSPVTALQAEPSRASVQQLEALERRIERVERRVDRSEDRAGAVGITLLLIAFFCALWAQNTGRSAWLWFCLGLFFHFLALTAVLIKNADYVRSQER